MDSFAFPLLAPSLLSSPLFAPTRPSLVLDRYLEMAARTKVLNTRLDMLRELLAVLQQQQENHTSKNLEWIVIWLIVASAFVEMCAIAVEIVMPKHA